MEKYVLEITCKYRDSEEHFIVKRTVTANSECNAFSVCIATFNAFFHETDVIPVSITLTGKIE